MAKQLTDLFLDEPNDEALSELVGSPGRRYRVVSAGTTLDATAPPPMPFRKLRRDSPRVDCTPLPRSFAIAASFGRYWEPDRADSTHCRSCQYLVLLYYHSRHPAIQSVTHCIRLSPCRVS